MFASEQRQRGKCNEKSIAVTVLPLEFYKFFTIRIYRVGQKSKLLILSEYVNKTEKTECEQI